jgi:hypothetical protein
MAAERIIRTTSSWLERELFLKVSATKTKVVRPNKGSFLGFGFYFDSKEGKWTVRPLEDRKKRLIEKVKKVHIRRKAVAIGLKAVFVKLNQIICGWINYYAIGEMKVWLKNTMGPWLRHRVRAIMLKQWKKPAKIMKSLRWYCICYNLDFSDQDLYKVAHSSRGWYARANGDVVNFILSPTVLGTALYKGKGSNKTKVYPGLINPLLYYQSRR